MTESSFWLQRPNKQKGASNPEARLYVVVRADLAPGQIAVQACHAVLEFALRKQELSQLWWSTSNVLVVVTAPDAESLKNLKETATLCSIQTVAFEDPDLDPSLTGLVFEPGLGANALCGTLPLALAPLA